MTGEIFMEGAACTQQQSLIENNEKIFKPCDGTLNMVPHYVYVAEELMKWAGEHTLLECRRCRTLYKGPIQPEEFSRDLAGTRRFLVTLLGQGVSHGLCPKRLLIRGCGFVGPLICTLRFRWTFDRTLRVSSFRIPMGTNI
eukprot:g20688.t1